MENATDGVGGLLRASRLRAGMSQEDLAGVSGVSSRAIRMIENGHRRPRVSTVTVLAEALGLDEAEGLALTVAARPDCRAATAAPVPRQLPAAPTGFVGRRAELRELDARPSRLSCVVGMGGMGKTWLATRWAAEAASRFADGQLYLNLRGGDPRARPLTAEAGLRALLGALGVDRRCHRAADLDELSALFRSVTARRRVLVLLDDARDATQVLPLLPGGDRATTVVTCRWTPHELVTGHGARVLRLGPLPPNDSRLLLAAQLGQRRLDREPAAVTGLVEHCAGLPLALRLVAAHAADYPEHPLSAVLAELSAPETAPAGIGAVVAEALHRVLEPTLRRAGGEAAQLFALLARLSRVDSDVVAAAGITGLPVPVVSAALRRLCDAYLVTRDAAGRYRLPDAARRLFAGTPRG